MRELPLQNYLDEISRNVTVSEPAEGRRKITADLGMVTSRHMCGAKLLWPFGPGMSENLNGQSEN